MSSIFDLFAFKSLKVYGRNNVGPAIKKEVLLGTVLLGPELRSAELPGIEVNGDTTYYI